MKRILGIALATTLLTSAAFGQGINYDANLTSRRLMNQKTDNQIANCMSNMAEISMANFHMKDRPTILSTMEKWCVKPQTVKIYAAFAGVDTTEVRIHFAEMSELVLDQVIPWGTK